jgi:hypothetical protein
MIDLGRGRRHTALPEAVMGPATVVAEVAPVVVESFKPSWVSIGRDGTATLAGTPTYAQTVVEGFPVFLVPHMAPQEAPGATETPIGVEDETFAGFSSVGPPGASQEPGEPAPPVDEIVQALEIALPSPDADLDAVWDELDQAWQDAPDPFACGEAFGCAVETGREQAKQLRVALLLIDRLRHELEAE